MFYFYFLFFGLIRIGIIKDSFLAFKELIFVAFILSLLVHATLSACILGTT